MVGFFNEISGEFASVSGGEQNTASGGFSSVSGGLQNTASGVSLLGQRGIAEHGQRLRRLSQRGTQPNCTRPIQLGGWSPLRRTVGRSIQETDTKPGRHIMERQGAGVNPALPSS